MIQKTTKSSKIIQCLIKEFNTKVVSKPSYEQRRLALKTPVIFHDDKRADPPLFESSNSEWCCISLHTAQVLLNQMHSEQIIRFDAKEESKFLENQNFISKCRSKNPEILMSLALSYLKLHIEILSNYPLPAMNRVKQKIEEFNSKLAINSSSITSFPRMIEALSKEIKLAKLRNINEELEMPIMLNRNYQIQTMIKLRREGKLTIKEICEKCSFSPSTYYSYCHRVDQGSISLLKSRGRQFNENSLNDNEKKFIKEMADNPRLCYTVPQMCLKLLHKFNRNLSKKKVYRYLSKDLGYTFKVNSYSAPPAFEPVQNIIRYKIAKKLISFYKQDKILLFFDETGIDLTLSGTRSYSKKGIKPCRMKNIKSERLNILMGITKDSVLCYQVIKGSISELNFINFMLSFIDWVSQKSSINLSQLVLVLDNYSAHTSSLALKFLEICNIQTLFTPTYYCFLNPIETYFSILKRNLRKTFKNTMYFLCYSNH